VFKKRNEDTYMQTLPSSQSATRTKTCLHSRITLPNRRIAHHATVKTSQLYFTTLSEA
jgi:hypothetical protein